MGQSNRNSTCNDHSDQGDDEIDLFQAPMSARVADKLANRLQESFQTNVENLPMLRDADLLIKQLKDSYLVHVDVLEQYCYERIFAVKPFATAKQSRQIIDHCNKYKSVDDVEIPSPEEQQNVLDSRKATAQVASNEDIRSGSVSPEILKNMQKEIVLLRKELSKVKSKREKLQQRLSSVEQARKIAGMASQANVSIVHDSLTAVVLGASSLAECDDSGKEYLESMKRGEDEEVSVDLAVDVSEALRRKRLKMMTLEERYEEECQQTNLKACFEEDGPHRRLLVVNESPVPSTDYNSGSE